MNQQLQLISLEGKRRAELEKSIQKKRKKLFRLQALYDRLNRELSDIQQAYEERIGKLYGKDNQLDIEIIRYKNIVKLMEEGLSYSEALAEIEGLYTTFFTHSPTSEEDYSTDFFEYLPSEKEYPTAIKEDVKKLWKKLLFQFHPDLISNEIEKRNREEIIKVINKAYKENNYDKLKILETRYSVENYLDETPEQLEYALVEIENSIITYEKYIKKLKISEWYSWKIQLKKSEKINKDIFASLEKSLLDDIVSKTKILNSLKTYIEQVNKV